MEARRLVLVMLRAYRLATGNALQPEDAVGFLRDPKAFSKLIESSGALDDPIRRAALDKLIQEEESDGL